MIQNRSFDITVADYNELLEYAPELCPQYILLNQDGFAEEMDSIELIEAVFEVLLMSDGMNSAVKESIIKRDGVKLMTKASAEYLSRRDIELDRSVFKAIWEKIDSARKKEFLFHHIWLLDADDYDSCFAELGDPYDKLKRTPYRHDEFIPDTPHNRELVDRLQSLQFLTSYEYETQTQNGSKRADNTIHVIRCRLKAKVDDSIPVKAK